MWTDLFVARFSEPLLMASQCLLGVMDPQVDVLSIVGMKFLFLTSLPCMFLVDALPAK